MTKRIKWILLMGSLMLATSLLAQPYHWGVTGSYGSGKIVHFTAPKDPYGVRFSLWLHPDQFVWGPLIIYGDLSYAQWHTGYYQRHEEISIFTIAPVFRLYLTQGHVINPYLEASIGGAYMASEQFGNRDLGSRIAFQDRGGFGLAFGQQARYFVDVQVIHYSNAGFNKQNSGLTIPLMFNIGLQLK